MPRLKLLLQSKYLYFIVFVIVLQYVCINAVIIKKESVYNIDTTEVIGTVISYKISEDKISITLKAEEKLIVNYYLQETEVFDSSDFYGKTIKVTGSLKTPINNTIPNTFNYKKYLYNNDIFYTMAAKNIEIMDNKVSFSSFVKNNIVKKIEKYKSSDYLKLFLLGDKSQLDSEVYTDYQKNGIAHLLAISGLHISIFIIILEKILIKLNDNIKMPIIIFILYLYLVLTNYLVSIIRCVLYQLIRYLNKLFDIHLTSVQILIMTAFIVLFINPFYIYDVGFLYSYTITFFLLSMKTNNDSNYIKTLLKVSVISLLASLPITVSMNYEINITSILLNLVYVPYVSFVIFPLSLITFILPFFDLLLNGLTNIMELTNSFCETYLSIMINIPKMSYVTIFLYYILLYLLLKFNNKYMVLIFVLLIFNKYISHFNSNYELHFVDVGQGDCHVLISPYKKEVIMIDTGGNINYEVSTNVIVFLKSIGVTKLDILILSHGDTDHALETENISKEIDIKNIYFNENEINELESSIKKLEIDEVNEVDLKYFKSKNYNADVTNENDASIILFFKLYNTNVLYTGDAGTSVIKKALVDFNERVDIYKVSHHGSLNNTDEVLMQKIDPITSIVSVGRTNSYNHPNPLVVDILNNYSQNLYTTSENGTISVSISKFDYTILTQEP